MALKVCAHIVAVAFLLGNVQQATADLLTVQNHSFEADFAADGTFPTFTPTGWQTYDPFGLLPLSGNAVGVLNPNGTTFFPGGAPDGDNVALIFLEDREMRRSGVSVAIGEQGRVCRRFTCPRPASSTTGRSASGWANWSKRAVAAW